MEASKELRFEAASVAYAMHKGQKYGDQDYFLAHVCPVAAMVERLGGDDIDVAIAYLHDVLEDTNYSQKEMNSVFGEEIYHAVLFLTKVEGESYETYMDIVQLKPRTLLVKKADTLCNLQQSMKEGNAKRIEKYTRQLAILNGVKLEG